MWKISSLWGLGAMKDSFCNEIEKQLLVKEKSNVKQSFIILKGCLIKVILL